MKFSNIALVAAAVTSVDALGRKNISFDRLKGSTVGLLGLGGNEDQKPLPKPFHELEWKNLNVFQLSGQLISLLKPATRKNVAMTPVLKYEDGYGAGKVARIQGSKVYDFDVASLYFACATEELGEFTPVDCRVKMQSFDENLDTKEMFVVYKAKNTMQKVNLPADKFSKIEDFIIRLYSANSTLANNVDARILIDNVIVTTNPEPKA